MMESQSRKRFDLEERTLKFAKNVNDYVRVLPKNLINTENGKQLVRSGGSVGANYIEANEALSRKDFAMRIKICRKEAKESGFWLKLTQPIDSEARKKEELTNEAGELTKIFGAIIEKCK